MGYFDIKSYNVANYLWHFSHTELRSKCSVFTLQIRVGVVCEGECTYIIPRAVFAMILMLVWHLYFSMCVLIQVRQKKCRRPLSSRPLHMNVQPPHPVLSLPCRHRLQQQSCCRLRALSRRSHLQRQRVLNS